jgi:hypothetical protein
MLTAVAVQGFELFADYLRSRDAPVALTWKLRVTWSFHTCYACFISS